MPDFSLSYGPGYSASGAAGGNLVASATPNVKGSFTTIIASTGFDADSVLVSVAQAGNTATHLYDIAVGGAGSEVVIASNVLHGGHSRMMSNVPLPIEIPAGSRISGRVQSDTASAQLQARVTLIRSGLWAPPPGGSIVTLGADTSDSGGVAVDAGAVINTPGAYSVLAASTSVDIAAVLVRIGNRANSAPSDGALNAYLTLAVGGSGAEVPFLDSLPFSSSSNGSYGGGGPSNWFPAGIPAGSRITARLQANSIDATDRVVDVVLLGLVI